MDFPNCLMPDSFQLFPLRADRPAAEHLLFLNRHPAAHLRLAKHAVGKHSIRLPGHSFAIAPRFRAAHIVSHMIPV